MAAESNAVNKGIKLAKNEAIVGPALVTPIPQNR